MKVSKLYEIPEDVARILRNTGVTVVTKHYIEEIAYGNKPEDGVATSRIPAHLTERPGAKRRRITRTKIVEVGDVTPKELKLRKGRRFYGEKAQALLLQRKRGIPRNRLAELLIEGDRYQATDNAHTVACQITNLVGLGVLSYKS
jgi:hypothetical protein